MARTVRWAVVLLGAAVLVAILARQLVKPRREEPLAPGVTLDRDRMVDEEVDESFPASDAPSHWAGGSD
jgi:hypothetical protein